MKTIDVKTSQGELLRDMRVRAGLTQHDIARTLGVTQSRVSKIENGPVSLTEFLRVAEQCGFKVALIRHGR